MEPVGRAAMEALRRYVHSYEASVVQFARYAGLSSTDGNALGEVVWAERAGAPLTPTVLAARIAMTTGATTALLNRLESQDLLARSREHQDRRTVTLRSTARARELVDGFAERSRVELAAALGDYTDTELTFVAAFVDRFAGILPGDPAPLPPRA